MAQIGEIIQGKYEILKLIGKGGMSQVYLAMDQNLNKQWAVKEIEKRVWDKNHQVVVQSAMAEANMIKKLDHPALPRIVDIIDKADVIYVIMDYIEGEPLSNILAKQGAQSQERVIEWAKQLCEVLDYLHTCDPPIIYRDMKPANVMLQPNGNVKLIDFGIAREYKEQNLADTVSLGTKGYAAPEQFGGRGQTDARTDVYGLGVTLYHLLTGKNPCEPPYELYPIRYWNPQLSGGLESVVMKCTQLNPEDRYQSCAEVLYALNHHNELDDSYRRRQKRKMQGYIGVVATGMACIVVGMICQILKARVNNSDYENILLQAEKSATSEEKVEHYLTAIDIKPAALEAYFGMIDAYKDDAVFSIEEEARFKQKINLYLPQLQENEDYSDLAFEVGKLYWYYFDYGRNEDTDNQVTRMMSAVKWFNDAYEYGSEEDSYYDMSKIYGDIGQFNREITLNVQEAADKGTYSPYWENLKSLVEIVAVDDSENEIVNLEVYKLAVNSMETYARKFKADGITQSDMLSLWELVKTGIEGTVTTTDKTEEMRNKVISRLDVARTAINNAYA